MSIQVHKNMRKFIGFVYKELLHIFRDYRTLSILFGIPVMQILIFGFVVTNEIKDVRIAILDHSRDDVTLEITEKILSSGYFRLSEYIHSPNQIGEVFKRGAIKEVIIFESAFAEKLERTGKANIQLIADASDANTGMLIVNYTQGVIRDYQKKLSRGTTLPIDIITETRMQFNPALNGVYMFVPGTMALILILISALMTSVSIAREKEFGTMETLLVSPLKPYQIIAGKVTPYIFLSFINAVIIVLLGQFVFGVPVLGSYVLLMLITILYIILALSLGIFVSTVSNNQQTAMMISLFALLLPTLLLSGFIFPTENMPLILQWLSEIVPTKWFIITLKHIMLKGSGFEFVWVQVLKMVVMTLFFITLGTLRLKPRLE